MIRTKPEVVAEESDQQRPLAPTQDAACVSRRATVRERLPIRHSSNCDPAVNHLSLRCLDISCDALATRKSLLNLGDRRSHFDNSMYHREGDLAPATERIETDNSKAPTRAEEHVDIEVSAFGHTDNGSPGDLKGGIGDGVLTGYNAERYTTLESANGKQESSRIIILPNDQHDNEGMSLSPLEKRKVYWLDLENHVLVSASVHDHSESRVGPSISFEDIEETQEDYQLLGSARAYPTPNHLDLRDQRTIVEVIGRGRQGEAFITEKSERFVEYGATASGSETRITTRQVRTGKDNPDGVCTKFKSDNDTDERPEGRIDSYATAAGGCQQEEKAVDSRTTVKANHLDLSHNAKLFRTQHLPISTWAQGFHRSIQIWYKSTAIHTCLLQVLRWVLISVLASGF